MPESVFAAEPELPLRIRRTSKARSTTVLLGAYLRVLEESGDWYRVRAFGEEGWVLKSATRGDCGLKFFFVDVGQGDGCLVETADNKKLVVDGGPRSNFSKYLTRWKYKWLIESGQRVKIDAMVVSHFDWDHFNGLTAIINHPSFRIETIYHNGIARFLDSASDRPASYNTRIGKKQGDHLKTTFNDIESARDLLADGGLMVSFRKFIEAVVQGYDAGRIGRLQRLTYRDEILPGFTDPAKTLIEVLGPVPTSASGRVYYDWFSDEGHTINGHSVVLKINYGDRSVLLGGDLNSEAERHLLSHYGEGNPFRVDFTKACHHGSSDFTVGFMKAVKPFGSVFSSGDNEAHTHPRADALGCAGRYSRGRRPLILATELARSTRSSGDIHYGLINLRSDGEKMVLAQMKESRDKDDLWTSYVVE